eukprot:COSAG01_NODE_30461_length_615_cov_1.436047_2_plen_67_part_01
MTPWQRQTTALMQMMCSKYFSMCIKVPLTPPCTRAAAQSMVAVVVVLAVCRVPSMWRVFWQPASSNR